MSNAWMKSLWIAAVPTMARNIKRQWAYAAAADAAWAAARDARLNTLVNITCADLEIDQKHRDHAARRWEAWKKGYAVLCDVNGVLYVYAKK